MTKWFLSRIILFLAFAAAAAGTYYRETAEQHAKPGQHRVDRNFGPSWPEFYTPEGQLYLRLGRWLQVAAFVLGAAWIYWFVLPII